jgi:hypothetical protein
MTEGMIGHNEPKNKDWIAVYRSLRTHPIVGFLNPDGTRRKGAILCDTMAWIDLCMQANWKDLRENNKGHPVIVERGQLQGGRAWLAQRWGWTEKKVRIFLKKLTDDKMLILGPAKGPEERPAKRNITNIITICNYDIYQTSIEILDAMEASERATEGASEGPARGHTVTKEQGKQEEEEESLSSGKSQSDAGDVPKTVTKAVKLVWEMYNETAKRCGLSEAKILNTKRASSLKERLREAGGGQTGVDTAAQALANLEKSAFCLGNNDSGWKANFDYFVSPKGFLKLYEGAHGNGLHATQDGRAPPDRSMSFSEQNRERQREVMALLESE